jgi:hypothetical protein
MNAGTTILLTSLLPLAPIAQQLDSDRKTSSLSLQGRRFRVAFPKLNRLEGRKKFGPSNKHCNRSHTEHAYHFTVALYFNSLPMRMTTSKRKKAASTMSKAPKQGGKMASRDDVVAPSFLRVFTKVDFRRNILPTFFPLTT